MNWYNARLLFAQKPEDGRRRTKCESCHVLFAASCASECYEKAVKWAEGHEHESLFKFLGIEHIGSLVEPPADGVEVDGRFFDDDWVWERVDSIIPKKEEIPVILLERNKNRPVGEFMTEQQKKDLREILGEDDED